MGCLPSKNVRELLPLEMVQYGFHTILGFHVEELNTKGLKAAPSRNPLNLTIVQYIIR